MNKATLFIVATPIGNLSDMVPRAVEVLQTVVLIAAEDSRHSGRLLAHFNIKTPVISYHEHSTEKQIDTILQVLGKGESVALISDAGTPLISDPGYRLVREVRQAGFAVTPIPGACAAIVALCAAGLPTDRFVFEGFLPAKTSARRRDLTAVEHEERTLVFYEAPHRIEETLADMAAVLGGEREAVIARELTKIYETIIAGTLNELLDVVRSDDNQRRGELVVLVRGSEKKSAHELDSESARILSILLESLSVKQAAELAAKITGISKKVLYQAALAQKE